MKTAWAAGIEAAWYRGDRWLFLLVPLETCFRVLVALRRWAYRCGLCKTYRAPVPVVAVGNLTPGGTGKTAVVIALANDLQSQGLRVGIVSRGYGAAARAPLHVVSAASEVNNCGDEALLIHRRTGAPCVTARSRALALQRLLDDQAIDIVLSDDGLQHYAMARDFEVVLYDQQSGFGNGRCFPAGPLREPLSRLGTVDCVLGRGAKESGACVWYEPAALVNVTTGEQRPFNASSVGPEVFAVAALGRPKLFLQSLKEAGFSVQPVLFPDHYSYNKADLASLSGKPIIMTEKDAVKCASFGLTDAWFLSVSAVVPKSLLRSIRALASA